MPTEVTNCKPYLKPKCCQKTSIETIEDVYGGALQPTFPNNPKSSIHIVKYTDKLVYYQLTNREWEEVESISLENTGGTPISLTTTGTTGAATLVDGTLNIPNYTPDYKKLVIATNNDFTTHTVISDTIGIPFTVEIDEFNPSALEITFDSPITTNTLKIISLLHSYNGQTTRTSSSESDASFIYFEMPPGVPIRWVEITVYN